MLLQQRRNNNWSDIKLFHVPRGTKDIFSDEAYLWHETESSIRKIFYEFNFEEIRTPMFESTELFTRSSGNDSDIVKKEMYNFIDKSGRSLTLKPEGTAPVVRSAIEHNLFIRSPKLFYFMPMFRYERPQAGRYREFYQCGAEFFGAVDANFDVEIILLAYRIINSLKINDVILNINSIGCEHCRKIYDAVLKNFITDNIEELCADCKTRYQINSLRILDCKNDRCKEILIEAPNILDCLCDDCRTDFDKLQNSLTKVNVKFEINNRIVRGLDYYTRTVFEFVYNGLTVCGGGHYSNLVYELGGPNIESVGFAFGFERLINILKEQGLTKSIKKKLNLFIATLDSNAYEMSQLLAYNLREYNLSVERNCIKKSIKSQIKLAQDMNAEFLLVIGEDELKSSTAKLKNMLTRNETIINLNNIREIAEAIS
jgi:histidyl-tRNA synthetase